MLIMLILANFYKLNTNSNFKLWLDIINYVYKMFLSFVDFEVKTDSSLNLCLYVCIKGVDLYMDSRDMSLTIIWEV